MVDIISLVFIISIIFIFINEEELKNIKNIHSNINIYSAINEVKENLIIYEYIEDINKSINDNELYEDKKYIMLKQKNIKFNDDILNMIIANYIDMNYAPCGFNGIYMIQDKYKNNFLRYIYQTILNLTRLFDKKHFKTYPIVIFKKIEDNTRKIISFMPSKKIVITIDKINKEQYIEEIDNLNKVSLLNILLYLYFSVSISLNMIYVILKFSLNIRSVLTLIITGLIYTINIYIRKIIFKNFNKEKKLFKYLFLIIYIILIFYIIYAKLIKQFKNNKQIN